MIISERIFLYIHEKGMTQKEFSKLTGISQSTISDWKTKKTNPAADKIMCICEVLHVSPQELLTGSEQDYILVNKNSKEYTLIENYEKFDEENRLRLLSYMKGLDTNK